MIPSPVHTSIMHHKVYRTVVAVMWAVLYFFMCLFVCMEMYCMIQSLCSNNLNDGHYNSVLLVCSFSTNYFSYTLGCLFRLLILMWMACYSYQWSLALICKIMTSVKSLLSWEMYQHLGNNCCFYWSDSYSILFFVQESAAKWQSVSPA